MQYDKKLAYKVLDMYTCHYCESWLHAYAVIATSVIKRFAWQATGLDFNYEYSM